MSALNDHFSCAAPIVNGAEGQESRGALSNVIDRFPAFVFRAATVTSTPLHSAEKEDLKVFAYAQTQAHTHTRPYLHTKHSHTHIHTHTLTHARAFTHYTNTHAHTQTHTNTHTLLELL